ncbi:MAG: hypothetical protein ACK5IJ_10570 [Mangrovibacterium sp.]
MKKVTLLSFAAIALLASCSTETETLPVEAQYGTISTKVAGFTISVQEENTFATKDVNGWGAFVADQYASYTYNLYNAGTTTAATVLSGSTSSQTGSLASWSDEFNWTLNYGSYDLVVTNSGSATVRPTTDRKGVVYTSTTEDISVAASTNSDATFGAWVMETTVVSAKAFDTDADTYLGTLQSYELTVGDLVIASSTGTTLSSSALAQGFFNTGSQTISFAYTSADGTTMTPITGNTAALTAGQEVVISIAAKNGTVGLSVSAPTGATTDGGTVDL